MVIFRAFDKEIVEPKKVFPALESVRDVYLDLSISTTWIEKNQKPYSGQPLSPKITGIT